MYNTLGFLLLSLPGSHEKPWSGVPYAIHNSRRNIQDQRRSAKVRADCETEVSEQRQGKRIITSEPK